ncbi:MAG TPA: hypothetical protein VF101_08885 [Gaiellaceae bacterium]
MKRLIIAALALAALVVGSPVASAGPTKTVSGTLTGSAEWQPSLTRANSWTIHGTYTSDSLGSGTYAGTLTTDHVVLDASVEDPPGCFETNFVPCNSSPRFVANGSITFTTNNGASFTGTVQPGSWVTGSDTVHVIQYNFGLDLAVTDGTRRFKHVTGSSLSLSYASVITIGAPGCGTDCGKIFDGGTLTGSI